MQTRFLALRIPRLRAQLALRIFPVLADRPFALVASVGERAQLLGLSDKAALAGLRTGMNVQQARRRLPDLQLVEEAPGLLESTTGRLREVLESHSPQIQAAGPADWLLDISGLGLLHPDEMRQARELLDLLREGEGLEAAAGIGSTALAARLLARRASIGSVHSVSGAQERDVLDGFPLAGLPDLPAALVHELAESGIRRVAEARALDAREVLRVFGSQGQRLLDCLHRLQPTPLAGSAEASGSWSLRRRLVRDSSDPLELQGLLTEMVEELVLRCRQEERRPKRLMLRLGWSDGYSHLRGIRPAGRPGESLRSSLRAAARELLSQGLEARRYRIRTLELNMQTEADAAQISLFSVVQQQQESRLDSCIRQLRGRYGREALSVGMAGWNRAG